jgi:hypothetical protein
VAQVQGGNCPGVQSPSFGADIQLSVIEADAAQKWAWAKLWRILLDIDARREAEASTGSINSNAASEAAESGVKR